MLSTANEVKVFNFKGNRRQLDPLFMDDTEQIDSDQQSFVLT